MIWSDLLFALRSLRKSALVTTTIVLCLGISIGATGTVFAWIESIVFDPVPGIRDLPRLVSLRTTTVGGGEGAISYPDLQEVRAALGPGGARTFLGLAGFSIRRFNFLGSAAVEARLAEPLWGLLVTANYFDLLDVGPIAGRTFRDSEDAVPGIGAVVVISHALWTRRFGRDPNVIGRRVRVNGREMEIVGVAPPGFTGTISHLGMDLWIPVTMHGAVGGFPGVFDERDARWLAVFGRLAPSVELATARAAVETTGAGLAARYPENKEIGLTARRLDVGPVDRIAPLFFVMLGITILVVLIVCSNVANLLLVRGAAREHEVAVRFALGARPAIVVRQLMTESLVLACGGIIVGAAVLVWGRSALAQFATALASSAPLTVVVETPIDARVVLVLVGGGVSTVFAFGLAPALRATRVPVRASLAAGATRGGSRGSGVMRGLLVSTQFALSLAVLVTAGLFLRRLDELQRVDRGFRNPEQVLLTTIDFTMSGVEDNPTRRSLVDRLTGELATLSGIRDAAAATFVPLGLVGYESMDTSVNGYVPQPGEGMSFLVNRVTPGYFTTMGIPIVRGRAIDATDREGAPAVAVVNEAFARRFWGTGDPIGRGIRVNNRQLTVVGIAADGKYYFLTPLDAPSPPFIYLSFAQWGHFSVVLHARSFADPLALVPSIQRTVTAADARLSVMSPSTLDAYSVAPYFGMLLGSAVLSFLGSLALLLAAFGLYAVTAYAVAQQQREIGIRMALGATPSRVVAGVLGRAARQASTGAVAGAALAAGLTSVLASNAPDVVPRVAGDQLLAFGIAMTTLAIVAVAAALIPAMRAARMDPTAALREE